MNFLSARGATTLALLLLLLLLLSVAACGPAPEKQPASFHNYIDRQAIEPTLARYSTTAPKRPGITATG